MRRVVVILLLAFVAAGILGVFGYRQGTTSVESDRYRLEVSYPQVSRPGLPSNWELRIGRADGQPLPEVIEVVSEASYFDIFDENGLDPDPERTWQEAGELVWQFEPPDGSTGLVVTFDARLQPNIHWSRSGSSTLRIDGRDVATVSYRTRVVP
jgi:hypothetical protein